MPSGSVRDVFINCPFDDEYTAGFQALVFAVLACGFRARCAREMDDATETRIDKLYRIIEQSRYGIHDLCRTEVDNVHGLPRFNMPLELGIYLGAKRFGEGIQKNKRCLILDIEQFRFQRFISDLAGMDVQSHEGSPRVSVRRTRDWLVTVSRRTTIPSTAALLNSYDRFSDGLPDIAHSAGFDAEALAYPDLERIILAWVKANPI